MSLFAPDAAPPGHPYWWDHGAPVPPLPERPPPRADLLVIGAGYTGLGAAIAAAEAGAEVVAVDAGVPGQGASTRNGGMFGAHPRLPYQTLASRFGAEVARGVYGEARVAYEHTAGLIEREAIACDFQPTGRIQLAWTRADFAAQRRLVEAVTAVSDIRMEIVEREALAAEIATDRYFGAIRFPDHAAVHPRKLHDGMLAAALRRGVTVVANCPVAAVEPEGSGFAADTTSGRIVARRVVLAGNGYTRGAFRWLRRRVFPLPSFLLATEPLDPGLLARLAPGRRMMVETRARHAYYRLSPDGGRILFGGRAAMTPMPPERAAARLHRTMTDIWPELAGVRLTHAWSGMTGFAFTHMPHVGAWRGMQYALGYSGSGVALAPYLGAKAAFRGLGDPRGATAYAATRFATRAFHPGGAPWFLHAADLWFRHVVDRRQDAAARRDRRRSA
jgi:glycine/D-amino acid oxidase-like deaminating enzyme